MNKHVLILLFCCSYTTLSIAESASKILKHNPFERPQQQTLSTQMKTNGKRVVPQFELRAIIVSRSMPMVNVDGTIMYIDDELNGLKLIVVKEGEAKFSWDGKEVWLKIGMNQVDSLYESPKAEK